MEDSVSVKSSDSTAVSDEFEIINGQTVVTASVSLLKKFYVVIKRLIKRIN